MHTQPNFSVYIRTRRSKLSANNFRHSVFRSQLCPLLNHSNRWLLVVCASINNEIVQNLTTHYFRNPTATTTILFDGEWGVARRSSFGTRCESFLFLNIHAGDLLAETIDSAGLTLKSVMPRAFLLSSGSHTFQDFRRNTTFSLNKFICRENMIAT